MSLKLKIIHISSIARSGETILLRDLSVHPDIHVVHDLIEGGGNQAHRSESQKLFSYIRINDPKYLTIDKLQSLGFFNYLKIGAKIIILKQGVFNSDNKNQFGFIRSPLYCFNSLYNFEKKTFNFQKKKVWFNNRLPRIIAWSEMCGMETNLLSKLKKSNCPAEQFVIFYEFRFNQIIKNSKKIFTYENYVKKHKENLSKIVKFIGIPDNKKIYSAYEYFPKDLIGHGYSKLSEPTKYFRKKVKIEKEYNDKISYMYDRLDLAKYFN